MRIAVFVACLVAVIACFAQADDEATIHKQLGAVKDRMKIERKDYGEDGTIFKVWITPPEKPSYDEEKYTGLSEFARALDVPCKKVEIGLNSFGPSGAKDLSLTLGFHKINSTGGIFIEFHLPKSHSGHEKGLPFLVLICSDIFRPDGKLIDWIPTPLALMEPSDIKGNEGATKPSKKEPIRR